MSVKSFHTFSGRNDFLFILARFLQGDDNGDGNDNGCDIVSIPSEIMRILCYETLKHGRSSKRLLNVLSNNINMLIFTANYTKNYFIQTYFLLKTGFNLMKKLFNHYFVLAISALLIVGCSNTNEDFSVYRL